MERTLVIGIDSATWDVIDPLLQSGQLTAIEKLVEDGTRGTIESTIPPMTPVASTTAVTGVNPGKYVIYDFSNKIG